MSRRIFSPSCISNHAFVSFTNTNFVIKDFEKDMIAHVPDGEEKPEFIINSRFGYYVKSVCIIDYYSEEIIKYLIPQDKNGIPVFSFDMPNTDVKIDIEIRKMEDNRFYINYLDKNHITELYNDDKTHVSLSFEKSNGKPLYESNPSINKTGELYVSKGTKVHVKLKLDDGYAIRTFSVINERNLLPVETLTPIFDGNFSFIMPEDNVTVICQTFKIDDYDKPRIGKEITIKTSNISEDFYNPIIESVSGKYKDEINSTPIFRIGEKRTLHIIKRIPYDIYKFRIYTGCNNYKGQIPYKVLHFEEDRIKLEFIVPDCNIGFETCASTIDKTIKEKSNMENKEIETKNETVNTNGVIATFDIPEELAKELSELLTKQSIRQNMLKEILISNPSKYEEVESLLLPVTTRIETIKAKITTEYVPDEYCDEKYMWNYDGYDISGTSVSIFEN